MQTMNYKEAARYLKVTEGTLRNWVSKGRIKPRKVGKHVLFFKEELESWIKSPPATPSLAPKDLTDLFAEPLKPAQKPEPRPVCATTPSSPREAPAPPP